MRLFPLDQVIVWMESEYGIFAVEYLLGTIKASQLVNLNEDM